MQQSTAVIQLFISHDELTETHSPIEIESFPGSLYSKLDGTVDG